MMKKVAPTLIKSVDEIPAKYKGILLDQYGVLHNGKNAYPGAVDAVRRLKESGRKIVILSNSSRRSDSTLNHLADDFGFDKSCFYGAVTSGETTFQSLKNRPDHWWQKLGKKCLYLTWFSEYTKDTKGLDDLEIVTKAEDADFIIAYGTEAIGQGTEKEPIKVSHDEIKAMLEVAHSKKIPLLIANPDFITVNGGEMIYMPGLFARWYTAMGGEVRLMGKPAAVIYEAGMKILGMDPSEVIGIGDSLEHDICGANGAGISCAFIGGGIHAEELEITPTQLQPNEENLDKLCGDHACHPTFVLPWFR